MVNKLQFRRFPITPIRVDTIQSKSATLCLCTRGDEEQVTFLVRENSKSLKLRLFCIDTVFNPSARVEYQLLCCGITQLGAN